MTLVGEHLGLAPDVYHADPAIGSSRLKLALRSPAHFRASAEKQTEETKALRIGSALHCAVLEPAEVATRFVMAPKVDRRTKDGKAAWEAFQVEHAGKTVLADDEAELVHAMAASIALHPYASALMKRQGMNEASYFVEDPETGLRIKARPDRLVDGALMIDLKTTEDGGPEAWARTVVNYGYDVQAAHYRHALKLATGYELDFAHMVVEKSAPFAVAIYQLDAEFLARGERLRAQAMREIARAEKTQRWPSYGDGRPMTISVPRWAKD